ncbi:COR domain-containing protein [Kordia sp.]|uniref:COR domain-containing protein n=1 Tax=Kordia sp. TaxID=1965332 RepID=UPI003D6B2ED0
MAKRKRNSIENENLSPFEEAKKLILQNAELKEKALHIHLGNLTELPVEVCDLKHLEILCLHSNKLKFLPENFKNLSNLKRLILDDNNFHEIPKVLYEMKTLRSLSLSNNKISSIEDGIKSFGDLDFLELSDNDFGIPDEILSQTPKEIISFLLKFKKGNNTSLNEVKMILLGEANSGKTALVEKLTKDTFSGRTGITRGIDITAWNYENYKINIWDFGGQEIMRAMHQFFMTERTLYLLLWNSREDDINGKIEDWLELIKTYGGNSPVILVLSRCDDGNFDPDEFRLKDDYPENLKAVIRTSSKEGIGIEDLKNEIFESLKEINILQDKILDSWISVKTEVENIEDNYINLSKYYNICKKNAVDNNTDQISLLKLLKDLGIAFNYGEKDNPHTTNVLKPEWVTKGIYDIINSNELFQKQGKVTLEEIKKILETSGDYQGKENVILGLMKQFELCFSLKDTEFLIPDLLPEKQPYIGNEFDNSLQLYYKYEYMTKSIMPHFIARIHNLSRHIEGDESWYWRSGIIIEKNGNKALVKLNSRKKTLYIYIIGHKETRRDLLDTVRDELNILHSNIKGEQPKIIVPIPGNEKYTTSYKSLIQLEREGKKEIFIEDYGYTDVKPLLNGIEAEIKRKSTTEKYNELYSTEQQRNKEINISKLNDQLISLRKKETQAKKKLFKQTKIRKEIELEANQYASFKKISRKNLIITLIATLILIAIIFVSLFPNQRFVLPLISIILALLILGYNSLEFKFSIKDCYKKCYKQRYDRLINEKNYDDKVTLKFSENLERIKINIQRIEDERDCYT